MGLDHSATWVPVPDDAAAAKVLDHFHGGNRSNERRGAFVVLRIGECVVGSRRIAAEEASSVVGGDAFHVGIKEGEYFEYEHWRAGTLVRAIEFAEVQDRSDGSPEPWEAGVEPNPTQFYVAVMAALGLPQR